MAVSTKVEPIVAFRHALVILLIDERERADRTVSVARSI
jgi:hypothetical protein